MKSFLRIIGTVFSILMIVIFAVLVSLSLWGITVTQAIFSPEFADGQMLDEAAYQELLGPIFTTTLEYAFADAPVGTSEWYAQQLLTTVDESTQRSLAQQIMPQGWLRAQFERNAQATLSWYSDQSRVPDLYFGMGQVQQQLSGENAQQVAATLVDSYQACTPAEEEIVAAVVAGEAPSDTILPACSSRTLTEADLAAALSEASESLEATFPAEAERADNVSRTVETQFLNAKAFLRVVEQLSLFIFVFPLTALITIWFFSVRSTPEFFRWVGAALLIGGLAALILPLAVSVLPPSRTLLAPALSQMSLQGAYLLLLIFTHTTSTLFVQAGAISVLGVVCFIVGISMRKPQ